MDEARLGEWERWAVDVYQMELDPSWSAVEAAELGAVRVRELVAEVRRLRALVEVKATAAELYRELGGEGG
jgi:hypothetical protein